MALEKKSFPFYLKSVTGRTVSGIFAVFGNRDHGGDRIHPGFFTKTLSERKGKFKHLWNHNFYGGPDVITAHIEEIKELSRAELPPELLGKYPEASGGAMVTRTYYEDPMAEAVFQRIVKGDVDEMSFSYETKKADFSEETDAAGNTIRTRELREGKLAETSDVIFGMNEATLASMSLPPEFLMKSLEHLTTEIKAGRRNSGSDVGMIKQIHDLCKSLEPTSCGETADPLAGIPELTADDLMKSFAVQMEFAKAKLRHFEAIA